MLSFPVVNIQFLLPCSPLEDPHEKSGGLHGGLLVEPLELESDVGDVILGLVGAVALEGELAGQEDVEEHAQTPDVGLRESLSLLDDLRR